MGRMDPGPSRSLRPSTLVLLTAILLAAGCGGGGAQPGPPAPPAIIAFTATPAEVAPGGGSVLSWEVTGADAIQVGGNPVPLQATSLLVVPPATQAYAIVATNAGGESRATAALVVSAPAGPPADPPDVRVRGLSGGGAVVSWGLAGRASGYTVERRAAFEPAFLPLAVLPGAQLALFDAGLAANELYFYRVRASNPAGASPGAVVTVLAPPPPPEGPSLTVNPAAVEVTPGGTVLFTSSGPAAWSVLEGLAGGSISSAGAYRAPAGAGTWHVVASGGVSAVATVVVR